MHGISTNRFVTRTAREGWASPAPGVRIHPACGPSVQQTLRAACLATAAPAGAAGEAAAWLIGLRPRPPNHLEVLVPSSTQGPSVRRVRTRRVRWLTADDVTERDGVPVLTTSAWLLAGGGGAPETRRARIIDLLHRDGLDVEAVLARFAAAGPVPGKGATRRQLVELAGLRQESIFQAMVADELANIGYGAERDTRELVTDDGRRVWMDVPLPWWKVAVETDGDSYHRTREQRRRDRQRMAIYAATDWAVVAVDWRDWHLDRGRVLRDLDAVVARQRARGIGAERRPPT